MSCPNCGPSGAPARATVRERGARRTIALVGNPNVGKSTMFNHVTGARQKIVNAPVLACESWTYLARIRSFPPVRMKRP